MTAARERAPAPGPENLTMTTARIGPAFALRALLGGVCAILAFAPPGCGPENRAAPTVPLAYRPTDAVTGFLGGPGKPGVVRVDVFTDERQRKDVIGENVEEQDHGVVLPVYSSGPEPAEFVRQALIQNLRNSGFEVTDNPVAATRTISGRLTQFWVSEGNQYHTSVNAAIEVKDAAGQSLWNGGAGGTNTRFGRSLSVGNYQETTSDATVELLNQLFSQPGFRDALRTP